MSRIVPKDKAGDCAAWQAPDVVETAADALQGVEDTAAHLVTAGRLEKLQQAAYDEAFEHGRKEGLDAGRGEIRAQLDRLNALMSKLSQPFEELDDQVDRELLSLAFVIARQLIRRELRTDPKHVIGIVREAMSILPVASRDVVLHLHPEDAQLVREIIPESAGGKAWSVSEDPVLSRGSCRVTSAASQIDARVESRLGAIVSTVLGDDRSGGEDKE